MFHLTVLFWPVFLLSFSETRESVLLTATRHSFFFIPTFYAGTSFINIVFERGTKKAHWSVVLFEGFARFFRCLVTEIHRRYESRSLCFSARLYHPFLYHICNMYMFYTHQTCPLYVYIHIYILDISITQHLSVCGIGTAYFKLG